MERDEIEMLKKRAAPIMEEGRRFFGKEVYDNHIKEILKHFGYGPEDKEINEIFGI